MPPDEKRHLEDPAAAQQRFLSLFLRSEREIFRYVAALIPNVADAEDIVQQTALALWEKFDAYDPNQPFTPWACRFALNKARQWIERRQRWQALLEGGHYFLGEDPERAFHLGGGEEERRRYRNLLRKTISPILSGRSTGLLTMPVTCQGISR